MITGLTFRVNVRVSVERLERQDDDTRSLTRFIMEEIQSNLESLHGVFDVAVEQERPTRRTQ